MRLPFVAIAVTLVAAAGSAAAQPGNAPLVGPPPVPAIEVTEKSPATALILSLGGTVGSIALAGYDVDNDTLATIGGLGLWVAPSFGHWYAGETWTTGLTYRFAGAGLALGGLMYAATQCMSTVDEADDEDCSGGIAIFAAGGFAFVGGMVYDIATAPGAARRHNEQQRARVQGLGVQPVFGRDRASLSLTGRF